MELVFHSSTSWNWQLWGLLKKKSSTGFCLAAFALFFWAEKRKVFIAWNFVVGIILCTAATVCLCRLDKHSSEYTHDRRTPKCRLHTPTPTAVFCPQHACYPLLFFSLNMRALIGKVNSFCSRGGGDWEEITPRRSLLLARSYADPRSFSWSVGMRAVLTFTLHSL